MGSWVCDVLDLDSGKVLCTNLIAGDCLLGRGTECSTYGSYVMANSGDDDLSRIDAENELEKLKKNKPKEFPEVGMVIRFGKYKHVNDKAAVQKACAKLDFKVVDTVEAADLLVAPHLTTTVKTLAALAAQKPIVKPEWLNFSGVMPGNNPVRNFVAIPDMSEYRPGVASSCSQIASVSERVDTSKSRMTLMKGETVLLSCEADAKYSYIMRKCGAHVVHLYEFDVKLDEDFLHNSLPKTDGKVLLFHDEMAKHALPKIRTTSLNLRVINSGILAKAVITNTQIDPDDLLPYVSDVSVQSQGLAVETPPTRPKSSMQCDTIATAVVDDVKVRSCESKTANDTGNSGAPALYVDGDDDDGWEVNEPAFEKLSGDKSEGPASSPDKESRNLDLRNMSPLSEKSMDEELADVADEEGWVTAPTGDQAERLLFVKRRKLERMQDDAENGRLVAEENFDDKCMNPTELQPLTEFIEASQSYHSVTARGVAQTSHVVRDNRDKRRFRKNNVRTAAVESIVSSAEMDHHAFARESERALIEARMDTEQAEFNDAIFADKFAINLTKKR